MTKSCTKRTGTLKCIKHLGHVKGGDRWHGNGRGIEWIGR